MNERIRELAEGIYGSAHHDDFRFAELIIQECTSMLRDVDWAYDLPKDEYSENAIAVMAAKYIEEQFGVKQ